jgi:hypothetical protein
MTKGDIPPHILAILSKVRNKRAKIVIEHILKHGQVTTEDLEAYGYKHPPRAARDVRELGIPLETFRVSAADGRSIAAYRFGDLTQIRAGKLSGRMVLPKELKQSLTGATGSKCAVCLEEFAERYLQIDHRVPYEIAGKAEAGHSLTSAYMLLCGSCNRAKSWSCEHCRNWLILKDAKACLSCYWASPDNYSHISLEPIRRVDLVWTKTEVQVFDALQRLATAGNIAVPKYVKDVLARHVDRRNGSA